MRLGVFHIENSMMKINCARVTLFPPRSLVDLHRKRINSGEMRRELTVRINGWSRGISVTTPN